MIITPALRLERLAALLDAYGSINDASGEHDPNMAAPFPETDVRWLLDIRRKLVDALDHNMQTVHRTHHTEASITDCRMETCERAVSTLAEAGGR